MLEAFARSEGDARLVVTSRYDVTLPTGASPPARLHLPPMDPVESRKQALLKAYDQGLDLAAAAEQAQDPLVRACIEAARGNPRLQDTLHRLASEDREAAAAAIEALEGYLAEGRDPTQEAVRAALQDLALDALLGVLGPGERGLLADALLLTEPVPVPVLEALAELARRQAGDPPGRRLFALGLWEPGPDPMDPTRPAARVSPLVRPRLPPPGPDDAALLARGLLPALAREWGEPRPYLPLPAARTWLDLALVARDAKVAAAAGGDVLDDLQNRSDYAHGAPLARRVLELLDGTEVAAPVPLLRAAGQVLLGGGEAGRARDAYQRALAVVEAGREAVTPREHAHLLYAMGLLLNQFAETEEALSLFQRAGEMDLGNGDERNWATDRGAIADILFQRGELDEAERIRREEQLPVYEKVGDLRSVLVGRTNLAIGLLRRGREGGRAEARELLCGSLAAARRMGLPEAGQIEAILGLVGLECPPGL